MIDSRRKFQQSTYKLSLFLRDESGQAHESLELARKMEAAERRKFDLGDSNLLLVNLRELSTTDAAVTEVDARLNFFDAQADYRAALATDIVP